MTNIISDPSNNIIILKSLKKKIKELRLLESSITNVILYVLLFFIILVVTIIIYITTYNNKWLSRVKVKKTLPKLKIKPLINLKRTTQS